MHLTVVKKKINDDLADTESTQECDATKVDQGTKAGS